MSAIQVSQPARAPLAVSFVLSVLMHAGVVGGIATVFAVREFIGEIAPWVFARNEPKAEEEKPRSPDPDKSTAAADPVIWVTPGIDDSTSKAPVWIGYKDETEHVAYTASVDQSAMTPDDPGMRGEEATAAPPAPLSPAGEPLPLAPEAVTVQAPPQPQADQPASEAQAKTPDAAHEVNAPAPEVPDPKEQVKSPAPPPPAPAEPILVDENAKPIANPVAPEPAATVAREATPKDAPEKDRPQAIEPEKETEQPKSDEPPTPPSPRVPEVKTHEKESDSPTPTPPPATPASPEAAHREVSESKSPPPAATPQPGAKPTPIPAGDPGEKADKEADATSIKQAVVYRNGRVRAGEGVDIKTVRPEFSSFTVLTALPRAPVVEITFTTKGKVKSVRMLQSSGYKDVDEPILNAVWAWSAKGKKLEALARQNPNAVLKISVRMLL
jgi:TonB family protein